MLADIINSETGLDCEDTDETGECVAVFAPRPFVDDPELFLFVRKIGDRLLLTDGAEVYLYHCRCDEAFKTMAAIVGAGGLEFNNAAVELYCDPKDLRLSVEKYLAVMAALAARERDFNRMWAKSYDQQHAVPAR